jgi:hypothetical protein
LVLIVIVLAALLMAGIANALRRPVRPYSSVFGGFDPVVAVAARSGYTVQGVAGWNVFDVKGGYAFKEWRGVVAAPNDPPVCRVIQKAIEGYVEKVSQGHCHTDGTLSGEPNDASQFGRTPSHAVFTFNERERHGELHVWLFPDSSGSRVGYAIFLRDVPFE